MELDVKQKVLIAIYTEYQKDKPDMDAALRELGLDISIVRIALEKLENEQYITGFLGAPKSLCSMDRFKAKTFRMVMPTRDGIQFVEKKLGIDVTLTGKEKVQSVISKMGEWGYEQAKDMAAKVLAEILKGSIGI